MHFSNSKPLYIKERRVQRLDHLHEKRMRVPVEVIREFITISDEHSETEKERKQRILGGLSMRRAFRMLERTELGSKIVEIEAGKQLNPLTSTISVCQTTIVNGTAEMHCEVAELYTSSVHGVAQLHIQSPDRYCFTMQV